MKRGQAEEDSRVHVQNANGLSRCPGDPARRMSLHRTKQLGHGPDLPQGLAQVSEFRSQAVGTESTVLPLHSFFSGQPSQDALGMPVTGWQKELPPPFHEVCTWFDSTTGFSRPVALSPALSYGIPRTIGGPTRRVSHTGNRCQILTRDCLPSESARMSSGLPLRT